MRLSRILFMNMAVAVSVFVFACGVASFWISFQECASGYCYMNWDAPFLLFRISGMVNDGNFLLTTLGGLGLFVSGICVGHAAKGQSDAKTGSA